MTNKFVAAAIAVITAGAFASAAMADGPKLNSENFIPNASVPASNYDAAMAGPKVSSENRIRSTPPMTAAAAQSATGAAHWVQEQGYDPHGKWHWHWVLVP